MPKKAHALDRVLTFAMQPWALDPEQLAIVAHVLHRRLTEGPHALDRAELLALTTRADDPFGEEPAVDERVALIPLHGIIAPRMTMMSDISGGATFEGLRVALAQAAANPAIETVILDIDSNGGSVAGAPEAAAALRRLRDTKRLVAQVEHAGNSAAYWMAAQADEIIASPSAMVGSIGVYTMHDNMSGLLSKTGIERKMIAAGEEKIDGNPFEALSERAQARMQALVDQKRAVFVADVAAGRRRPVADVETWMARSYTSADAHPLGMIDRIATLEDTLARFGAQPRPTDAPQEPIRLTGQSPHVAEERDFEQALWKLGFSASRRVH